MTATSPEADMRAMFVIYTLVIAVGLAYALTIALRHS
jgi:hypothetical protein